VTDGQRWSFAAPTAVDVIFFSRKSVLRYTDTRSWARVQPDPAQPFSFPVFSTGFGDGVYTSYLGRDASGSPVCLVSDFDVAYVPASEPTPEQATTARQPAWWRFWRR